ncbi:MAG: S8 family serine peptidase, partial [Acidobacteriota bacterium]
MVKNRIMVKSGNALLKQNDTKLLHTYPNGDLLIQTDIVSAEIDDLLLINTGVRLATVNEEELQQAHHQARSRTLAREEKILAYLELIGPMDTNWLNSIISTGVELLSYQPENTYLCQVTGYAFEKVNELSFIEDLLPLTPALKGKVAIPLGEEREVWILIVGTQQEVSVAVQALNTYPIIDIDPSQKWERSGFYTRVRTLVNSYSEKLILDHPNVLAIEPYMEAQIEGEIAALIVAGQYDLNGIPQGCYLRWLEDKNINGAGVAIGIVDKGIDANNPAFKGRIKVLCDDRPSAEHSTLVACIAAGRYLVDYQLKVKGIEDKIFYTVGVAPAAELLSQGDCDLLDAEALCLETVTNTGPWHSRALIQNNSWGKDLCDPMNYTSEEVIYDRMVRNADPHGFSPKPLTICFSAGNHGKKGLTRPKAAKNIIVTGNSQSYRPTEGAAEADDIDQVHHSSSWGNCADGRIRPHIVAPGEWSSTVKPQVLLNEPSYFFDGGTSSASPRTAGACALLIQWWRQRNNGLDPSPAMLRALIVNGAVEMVGDEHIPNPRQGWGRINLANILADDVDRIYIDQSCLLNKNVPGADRRDWNVRLANSSKPIKITLTWTDPPGLPGSGTKTVPAIVNELALRVKINGKLYLANNFVDGWSVSGRFKEGREGIDNLQNIYLPAAACNGLIQISVYALAIRSDCLTEGLANPQQDFALVISNACLDEMSTPADIFIAIDEKLNGATKPDHPDDFWHKSIVTGDADELDIGWWQEIDVFTETPPQLMPLSSVNLFSNNNQTNIEMAVCQQNSDITAGLRTGIDLALAHGERIILPSPTIICIDNSNLSEDIRAAVDNNC